MVDPRSDMHRVVPEHTPIVYRFRSTVEADDYMRKHVAALNIMGDTIFREVEADIPAPVAIHDETCCMNGNFKNPHPECLGVRIEAGQTVLNNAKVLDSAKETS